MHATHRAIAICLPALLLAGLLPHPAAAQPAFIPFESGPVRPLALSPNGNKLFVTNIPDNRLEIFQVSVTGLVHTGSVAVGMEPVAVAARSNDEVWVVNHLSDSVSVVDLSGSEPEVVRTLLVGDEPRDIAIVGDRVFVATAHRGQHRMDASVVGVTGGGDPQLTTQGVGRTDVWVFDATTLGNTLGGTPLRILSFFGDTPRALAVNGNTVYVAVFHSGNRTTTVSEGAVCNGFAGAGTCNVDGSTMPGGNPGPSTDHDGAPAPEVGLIVKYDAASGEWRDELDRDWSPAVRFDLPDLDVFAFDATTLAQTAAWSGVGTILFNMAVNPSNGNLYVSNTEARNEVRFEGPGTFGGSTVQGHLAESRVTVISGASVLPRHLNKHIDYAIRPAPPGTKDHSLATPVEMAVSGDGATLYVAAFGSGRIGVFDTASLEADTFDPTLTSADYIDVSGGGPGGIVLDEARNRLFVYTRFDNGVSILDTATGTENAHFVLPNPEPDHVVDGRPFLYDAQLTSSNGEASCASCHIFGDLDSLAWDLGNPDDEVTQSPIPIRLETAFNLNGFSPPINGTGNLEDFHPMKGPMTTQTLRGMVNHGAMHWRGDRAVPEPVPADPFDSEQAFKNFNVAFPGLVGRSAELSAGEMQAFTDFALAITLPPNPIRDLSNALSSTQLPGRNVSLGKDFFDGNDGPDSGGGHRSDGVPFIDDAGFTCEGCHVLNPGAGHFGTDGEQSFENETQTQKIPHLRNLYQKLGMFGMIGVDFFLGGDNGHKGDQIRGFGYLHDGSVDTVFRFFRADVFAHQDFFVTSVGFEDGAAGDTQRRDIEAFMLAFDSDLAPIVGQQVSLSAGGDGSALGRVGLMIARAGTSFTSQILGPGANECDLIVKAVVDGEARGYLYDPVAATFESDRAADAPLTDAALRGLIPASTATLNYTCAPPGSGVRMGIDRDLDGFLDRDELDAETDPTNAGSAPAACNDGLDNDGDGDIDLADAGCNNDPAWDVENPACSNGVNDDNDGLVDGADPHCAGKPHRKRETPKSSCGLGAELILVLPPLLWWRGRRRR